MSLKGTEKISDFVIFDEVISFLEKNLADNGVEQVLYDEDTNVLHFNLVQERYGENNLLKGGVCYFIDDNKDATLFDIINKVSMGIAKAENTKKEDDNLIKEYKRPLVLSAGIIKKVYDEMVLGSNPRSACINAGLAPVTYHRYKKRYEEIKDIEDVSILDENDQKIIILFQKIEEGFLIAVNRNEAIIQSAGKESWQASAWFLERRMPELYAMKKEIKQETTEVKKVTTTDELKQLLGDCKELEDILNNTDGTSAESENE